ncbi:MAG: hypothetical protein NTY68_02700 [Candidatus Micrarchaeota archaeon]|nr:hypothetical protein [Candidatus Micrarchaeota archaeon]
MNANVYRFRFHEFEKERYRRHGIAIAELGRMAPRPFGRCSIMTEPLLEISPIKAAWRMRGRGFSDLPKLAIASVSVNDRNIPPIAAKIGCVHVPELVFDMDTGNFIWQNQVPVPFKNTSPHNY